jgi:FkbM family methyltransferase
MLINALRKFIQPWRGKGLGKRKAAKIGYSFFAALFNPIEVQGHRMFINPKDDVLGVLLDPYYEKEVGEVVQKEVKKGDVVADLGAHIGFYTLMMAKLVGKEGKVYAFEPDPVNFSFLKKNVERNGYKNVVLFQKAVSNETGKGNLYIGKARSLDRIYPFEGQQGSLEIERVRLDDVIQEKLGFIKMDVEGAEGLALQGMKRILDSPSLKMVLEINPSMEEEAGTNYLDVLQLLSGFRLHLIKKEGLEEILEAQSFFETQKALKEGVNVFCIKP